ncbi:hypothetical protein [Acinetobacter calcoaceticus]|uniref:hypothetical protein n=1 Tax=Acinetobacter calcoaceticus TaxID=471 RepID=UPI00124C3E33|nr:hypothetical protein [Acinetobacter calcoaceticus]
MRLHLIPLLLLAIPIAFYLHKSGTTLEDMANFLFWLWISFFVLSVFMVGRIEKTGGKSPFFLLCVGLFSANFLGWVFCKFLILTS